ncbi:Uncharacterised protein [uncultured archaeon]|nr:Uncharacterised protein [uncultured archaeon]
MKNLRTHAQIRVITKDGNLVYDSVNADILQVTTQKDLANSSGFFTIVLSPRIAKSQTNTIGTSYIPDIVKPFDLVQISFKTTGDYKTEMIGFVSRAFIDFKVDTSTGKPNRTLTIEGFDLTKAIQNYKLFFNPYVTGDDFSAAFGGLVFYGTEKGEKIFNSKNPAEFIKAFLEQAFLNTFNAADPKKESPYYGFSFGRQSSSQASGSKGLPSDEPVAYDKTIGIKLNDLIDFNSGISTAFKGNKMINPYILAGLGAGVEISIWDIAKSYSDPPFHECFVDLRRPTKDKSADNVEKEHIIPPQAGDGNQPYVFYMRTSPFSQDAWRNLNKHYFSPADLIAQNTATSEDNIYNYYQVICEMENVLMGSIQVAALSAVTDSAKLGRPRVPIFDVESMKNFGLKRFPVDKTKYVDFITDSNNVAQTAALDVIKAQATLARELFRWFSFGEDFETGTISLKGRVGVGEDGITIGSKLVELNGAGERTGKEFYIESVQQNWQFGNSLTTTISVTRGHFPENYTDALTNQTKLGRFNKVAQREVELGLDQASNKEYFNQL